MFHFNHEDLVIEQKMHKINCKGDLIAESHYVHSIIDSLSKKV